MQNLDAALGLQKLTGEFMLEENHVLDYAWKQTEFVDAYVVGGSLTGTLFENCTFINTTFKNIYLDHTDFIRCHFGKFSIVDCSHSGMEMRDCTGSPPTIVGSKEAKSAA